MRGCWIIGFLAMLGACDASQEPAPDFGWDYFPLAVGAYRIYTVDETQISQSAEQTFHYELMHLVVDSSLNQEGGYTYLIQRQRRDQAEGAWSKMDPLTARIANRQAIVKEGNISFVNLAFPVVKGLEWDGNAYNTLGGEQYCGESKDRACDIYRLESLEAFDLPNGLRFEETLTVMQNENTDLIVKQDVRKEVYARNIGLIFKESVVLEYCTTFSSNCLGQQIVENGLRYKLVMKEYGRK